MQTPVTLSARTVKAEDPFALWKGWTAAYLRQPSCSDKCQSFLYLMLHGSASGPEIGLPGRFVAGF